VRLHVHAGRLVVGEGAGRGAYVCRRESCLIKARSGRLLRRSLRARPELGDDLWHEVAAATRPGSSTPPTPLGST
jgi:predicted RNA-binding protein YlxR (DUF448 family)